jgi:hypothetical protein
VDICVKIYDWIFRCGQPASVFLETLALTDEPKQYLVILSLSPFKTSRLVTLVPQFKAALSSMSVEPIEQAFHKVKRDTFGHLLRSKISACKIKANIESPGPKYNSVGPQTKFPFLTGKDAMMVLEIGSDKVASPQFSRALTWLQRH